MRRLGLMALALIALAGCANLPTAQELYGTGPIPNRAYIERGFQQYLKTTTPGYFLVSENGAYGYSYCAISQCSGMEMRLAQDSCAQNSRGSRCWIYARDRVVVWNENAPAREKQVASNVAKPAPAPAPVAAPVQPEPKPAPAPAVAATTAAQPDMKVISRPIAIKWEGYPSLIAGTAAIQPSGDLAEITIVLPNRDGQCAGSYRGTNQGVWSVACTNGIAASGTYQAYGAGRGSSGIGKDTKGRSVEFTVGGST